MNLPFWVKSYIVSIRWKSRLEFYIKLYRFVFRLTPGLEAPATPESKIKLNKPLQGIIPRTPENTNKVSLAKSKIGNGVKPKKNSVEKPTANVKSTETQSKVRKKATAEVKPAKKAKTTLNQSGTKGSSGGRKSPPGSEAHNKSDVKIEKNIKLFPVTPDSKKILKIADLSALGMSPSTPSINKRNSKGETPLHVACIKV